MSTLNELALGKAGATLSALSMLLLGIGANLGIYTTAAQQMAKWHMFFNFTPLGIITGMIEAAIWGFVGLYAFGWLYNKFS